MGTMLQAHDLTSKISEGMRACNEILNVTRPDVVRAVHDAYFEVRSGPRETNTFGANWARILLSTTSPSGSKKLARRPVRVSRGSQQTIGQRRNSHDL